MDMARWLVALVGVVVVGACSAPVQQECARNTCAGCCTADGECVLGSALSSCGVNGGQCVDCASNGLVCNSGLCGQPVVDAGHDAGTIKDAGVDSGTPDAGPLVSVRMIYIREPETSQPGECPVTYGHEECYVTKEMTRSTAETLMASYVAHNCMSEWIGDGGHIRCLNNCTSETGSCVGGDGGTVEYSKKVCTWPPHTVADFCDWQP
jgi:hypothetical protein